MPTLADRIDHAVLRQAVRERYGRVVTEPGAPLGFPVGRDFATAVGYPAERLDRFPVAAAAFTGVGTPVSVARLQPGETVLDLGCGAGLDSAWAAELVGRGGRVVALDLALPMAQAASATLRQRTGPAAAVALVGAGEALPLLDASVDVVLVNGLFNLAPDKSPLLAEIRRVLRPTGRLVACEVALRRPLAPGEVDSLDDWFR
jgi:arsenite methyltransferase